MPVYVGFEARRTTNLAAEVHINAKRNFMFAGTLAFCCCVVEKCCNETT